MTEQRAFIQNQRLGRGVNIIGYDPLWDSRAKARMQDKHFRLIAEAGFDHVRINLHPFKYMGPGPDYALSPTWVDTLDWAVTQARNQGLLLILDLHEFHAMAKDPVGNKARMLAFWRQVAPRYAESPDKMLFELLNEPFDALTPALWNEYLLELHTLIRASNPQRTLIIGPGFWNNIDHLEELRLPDDDNIIVTVHYYRPMAFTHQGALWANYQDAVGTEWPATSEARQLIATDFAKAQAWSEQHKRPLYLGEFGVYDKADMDSRARYTSFMARHIESLGWSWGYWQFDSDFVVYDIDNDRWVVPLRDALLP